jgi:hypothetical protein
MSKMKYHSTVPQVLNYKKEKKSKANCETFSLGLDPDLNSPKSPDPYRDSIDLPLPSTIVFFLFDENSVHLS